MPRKGHTDAPMIAFQVIMSREFGQAALQRTIAQREQLWQAPRPPKSRSVRSVPSTRRPDATHCAAAPSSSLASTFVANCKIPGPDVL